MKKKLKLKPEFLFATWIDKKKSETVRARQTNCVI